MTIKCQCDADVTNHANHKRSPAPRNNVECKEVATERDSTSRGMQYMCKRCGDFCTREGFSWKREPL